MTRLTQVSLALLIAGLVCLLTANSPLVTTATAQDQNNAKNQGEESTRDAPPDTTPYRRPALSEDYAPKGLRPIPLLPGIFIVDAVVNNTDPNLTNTDTFNDGETSITEQMHLCGILRTEGISGPSNLQSPLLRA